MSLSKTLRGACLVGGLALSVVLAFATNAFASGTPVNVGTPYEVDGLAVATDNAGDAVLVWANDKDLPPITTDIVQYCVLPVGATGCTHSGNLIPADNASHVDHVQVLDEGSTIVVLADVYGASGTHSEEYEPEQEWQSTDGGATFSIVDGGKSVTTGVLSADTQPLSAVTLPGTDVLGYGWDTAGSSPPTFNAFPLTSPPQCSVKECTAGFASLEPNTNPDQIGNRGGQFAAQGGATPGVFGIFETEFSNGPLGCPGPGTASFGTAYVYGTGNQSSTNNYNVSPGTANSAWRVAISQADCDVEYPAAAGGPSGFGVLEDNLAANQAVYHRFDQSTDKFDTPLATVAPEFEEQPSVSQDGAGGIYATYLSGFGGAIRLAYSGDGGNTWSANTLNPDSDGGADHLTSNVNAAGQGWATWTDNGSVYAQSFQASDAISPVISPPAPTTAAATTLATTQTSGTATGASLTIPAGTVGETDRATLSGSKAAIATGTVTYGLYSNPTCTTKVFSGGATAVSGGIAAPSAGVSTALAAGTYYWQASYSGDANNLPSTSACGSEVLTVAGPPKSGGSGTSTESTVTVNVTCATFPCTITLTLTAPETVVVHAARAAKKKNKAKTIILAKGTFTILGPKKLTLHLTKIGKQVFAAHHGRLNASLLLSEKLDGHTIQSTKTLKIVPSKSKRNKK
jgi:hypothetical protein